MASRKTATVRARIEPNLKREAESILERIGLSQSDFLNMAYRQLVMRRGIPFNLAAEQLTEAPEVAATQRADRPSSDDRERARKAALEAIRDARTWAVTSDENSVDLIRRMRREREDYLAQRHKPRSK
jgi:DNA-damage-inducible protein J